MWPSSSIAETCEDGKTVSEDTVGHCCWPGQSWSRMKGQCQGKPDCPAGYARDGEDCRSLDTPSREEIAALDEANGCNGMLLRGDPPSEDGLEGECASAMKKVCAQHRDKTGTDVDSLRRVAGWITHKAAIGKNNPTIWRAGYYCLYELHLGVAGQDMIDGADLDRIALTKAKEWEAKGRPELIALQVYETLVGDAVGRQLRAIEGGKGFAKLARNNIRFATALIKDYGSQDDEQARANLGEAIGELLSMISGYISSLDGTPLAKEAPGLNKQMAAAERAFRNKRDSFKRQKAASARETVTATKAEESVRELCTVLQQLRQISEAEARERRVDTASGTVNLYQKRQMAAARIYSEERRKKLASEIAKTGYQFDQKRDCANSDE
jgi:molybdopterin converting factor small subunit